MNIRSHWLVSALLTTAVVTSSPARAADQALIDAAKKEGRVTWYSALVIDQLVTPVAAAFEKKYGVKVDYVRTTAAENVLRIANEAKAGRVQADVFDGFGAPALVREGLVASYIPDSAKRLPKDFYDPAGTWVATNLYILTPGYNTELVPPASAPKTFEDFLDPKWKGKLAWGSTPSPSAAAGFIGLSLAAMGQEKGMDYLRKLAGQRIAPVANAGRALLDQVIAGEYSIAMLIFNNHAVISKAKGAPSGWIPLDPSLGVLSVMSLTSKGPHPNAGKLLIDFAVSEEGQKLFRQADYMPADPDVPPNDPSLRPDGVKFRAKFFTPEEVDKNIPVWMGIYKDLFG